MSVSLPKGRPDRVRLPSGDVRRRVKAVESRQRRIRGGSGGSGGSGGGPSPETFRLYLSGTEDTWVNTTPAGQQESGYRVFPAGATVSVRVGWPLLERLPEQPLWVGDVPTGFENESSFTITMDRDKALEARTFLYSTVRRNLIRDVRTGVENISSPEILVNLSPIVDGWAVDRTVRSGVPITHTLTDTVLQEYKRVQPEFWYRGSEFGANSQNSYAPGDALLHSQMVARSQSGAGNDGFRHSGEPFVGSVHAPSYVRAGDLVVYIAGAMPTTFYWQGATPSISVFGMTPLSSHNLMNTSSGFSNIVVQAFAAIATQDGAHTLGTVGFGPGGPGQGFGLWGHSYVVTGPFSSVGGHSSGVSAPRSAGLSSFTFPGGSGGAGQDVCLATYYGDVRMTGPTDQRRWSNAFGYRHSLPRKSIVVPARDTTSAVSGELQWDREFAGIGMPAHGLPTLAWWRLRVN